MALERLAPADLDFVRRLADSSGETPESCYSLLFPADDDADDPMTHQGVVTTVVDGHFIALSMVRLRQKLGFGHTDEAEHLPLDLSGLDGLESLDCEGLGLTALDLSPTPALRELICGNNDLAQLDLDGLTGLEALDCSGNHIMVIDVRACGALRLLDCTGNEVTALVLPEGGVLEVIKASRNQLLALDVGDQPKLRELRCFRNVLHRLTLGELPVLEALDCARNELTDLALGACPRLQELRCDRNRIGALDLSACEALTALSCGDNYLYALDLSVNTALKSLSCAHNQLDVLDLSAQNNLAMLDLSGNRLEALDVSHCTELRILLCADNELGALDLTANGKLCALDVSKNNLASLDLHPAPELARLNLAGNPIENIDISTNSELCVLELGELEAALVRATDEQQHRLTELRERLALGSGAKTVAEMDSWELHDFALGYAWRDGEEGLLEVVRSPACDLGTALLIYWKGSPHYYLQYANRDEVPDYQQAGWDLLREIEARVEEGRFTHRSIVFDPRNDKQTRNPLGHDWTTDPSPDPSIHKRAIPGFMTQRTPEV